MTWAADLLSITEKPGALVAKVQITNGDESFIEEVVSADLTPESLGEYCRKVIDSREKLTVSKAAFSDFRSGRITVPDKVAASND